MPKFSTLDDFDFNGKTVLVRVDFNSPIDPKTKKILNHTRIQAHAETTIRELSQKGAKTVILAHQGRPGEPDFIPLKEHAEILARFIDTKVQYVDDLFGTEAQTAIARLKKGEVLVLKNVRTFADERTKGSSEEHAQSDFYVNDAFAAAHRAHISIVGFTAVLPSVAGRIMERELKALQKVLEAPEKPCVFIIGGAKGDDSLEISRYVLEHNIADHILTGGVIGHIFLVAKGVDLGKDNMQVLEKKKLLGLISGIQTLMREYPGTIEVPVDVALDVDQKRKEVEVNNLPTNYSIYDIGEKTAKCYGALIQDARTIVISGPMGVFENKEFMKGTKRILEETALANAFSLVGGGHTVAAVGALGLASKISYVSTAGGALIEFLMGKQLPGVVALEKSAAKH